MTLIIAAHSSNGIVLVGDKRELNPGHDMLYADDVVKVFELNSKVAIGGAGNAYNVREVVDEILAHPAIETMDVIEVKELLVTIAQEKLARWTRENLQLLFTVQRPEFGFLLTGYDKQGNPLIYSFSHSDHDPNKIQKHHCSIGIPILANYLLANRFKKDMSLAKLVTLLKGCVEKTSSVSVAVSRTTDIITIHQ